MSAFRRDKLRRLVEAGKMQVIGTYHFDDQFGTSGGKKLMECGIMPEDRDTRIPGVCYLFPSDFKSSAGCCWKNPNGTITLIVHSNSNYDFQLKH